jgi:hypothetical protein
LVVGSSIPSAAWADGGGQFIPTAVTSSTIPANGDLNPYGTAFVPAGFPKGGKIAAGDVLVSNFNNINNQQGTGTTIIQFTPTGDIAPGVPAGSTGNATTFFPSPLAGLSTALGVLRGGFVVVGNVPTTDGTFATISNGALQVLDRNGGVVATLTDSTFLDSPWDLTINDGGGKAQIFVSNVLSGTVSRLDVTVGATVTVTNKVQLATGYKHEPNDAALVLGPTGLAYDRSSDTLFVASTDDNAIFAVHGAGKATKPVTKGSLVFSDSHLRGPLALVFAPNGHLLTANGDAVNSDPLHPSEIVEFTRSGKFVAEYNVDASQGGSFGIATVLSSSDEEGSHGNAFNYAAIDDVPNDVVVAVLPASEGD